MAMALFLQLQMMGPQPFSTFARLQQKQALPGLEYSSFLTYTQNIPVSLHTGLEYSSFLSLHMRKLLPTLGESKAEASFPSCSAAVPYGLILHESCSFPTLSETSPAVKTAVLIALSSPSRSEETCRNPSTNPYIKPEAL